MKGKGITDKVFLLKGVIYHSKYLQKEICISFFDTEKCFDSLWLDDCINSLYENVAKTHFGDCNPIFVEILCDKVLFLGPF